MSRIKNKFLELRSKNQKALIAYVVAGYPNESGTLDAVRGLIKGGADIIELGLPFSDPLADGPVIQNASHLALKKGINLAKFIGLVMLGGWGLSLVFSFLAAIAAKAQQSAAIMAILGFPLIIPQLLMLMKVSNTFFSKSNPEILTTVVLLAIIDLFVIILAIILFPFLWKD